MDRTVNGDAMDEGSWDYATGFQAGYAHGLRDSKEMAMTISTEQHEMLSKSIERNSGGVCRAVTFPPTTDLKTPNLPTKRNNLVSVVCLMAPTEENN
jgi:hypothetical protein